MADDEPQSTDTGVVAKTRVYVVHDRTTGKVLHVHYSTTFGHASFGSETPEGRALRLSGAKKTVKLAVLEVGPEEIDHGDPIKVDIARRRVIRLSAPKHNVSRSRKPRRAVASGRKTRGSK